MPLSNCKRLMKLVKPNKRLLTDLSLRRRQELMNSKGKLKSNSLVLLNLKRRLLLKEKKVAYLRKMLS